MKFFGVVLAKCFCLDYTINRWYLTLGVADATPKILLKGGEPVSKVSDKVEEFIKPIVDELNQGIDIVEVEFAKKHNGDNLTVFIDKPNGVTIEDCELVHNAIDGPLDDLDPTEGKPYTLNVSSPGIDRPIVTDKDYARNIGQELELSLYEPIMKKMTLVGVLIAFNNDSVILEINNENLEIERKKISKATKFINF